MRISRWGLFWAIPAIKMQLEHYEYVRKEVSALDQDQINRLVPTTAEWIQRWESIYDSVKR